MLLSAAVNTPVPAPFLPRTHPQHIKQPCLHLTVFAEASGTVPRVELLKSKQGRVLYNTKLPKHDHNT